MPYKNYTMLEIVRTIQLFPKCMNNVLNAISKTIMFWRVFSKR